MVGPVGSATRRESARRQSEQNDATILVDVIGATRMFRRRFVGPAGCEDDPRWEPAPLRCGYYTTQPCTLNVLFSWFTTSPSSMSRCGLEHHRFPHDGDYLFSKSAT